MISHTFTQDIEILSDADFMYLQNMSYDNISMESGCNSQSQRMAECSKGSSIGSPHDTLIKTRSIICQLWNRKTFTVDFTAQKDGMKVDQGPPA